jgi:hypothetical protein
VSHTQTTAQTAFLWSVTTTTTTTTTMGSTDSSLRQQFAVQPNLLFEWLDEFYRGGDVIKAQRIWQLEPGVCARLRYTRAGEPSADVNKKRFNAMVKFDHYNAEQSTALHWLCSSMYMGGKRKARHELALSILEVDPTMHHVVDAKGNTPFGVLMMQRLAESCEPEYIGAQLAVLHRMLDLGLAEHDRKRIVYHLRRFKHYYSGAELKRLHQRLWDLALDIAFPAEIHLQFRRALLLLATGGRWPRDEKGGSVHETTLEALAIPGAMQPDFVWIAYPRSCTENEPWVDNTVPAWTLYVERDYIDSARAILKQLPMACETQLGPVIAGSKTPSVFHLATGNGHVFQSVDVHTTKQRHGRMVKKVAVLSDERERYAKRVEPLCIELLAETQRLFPQTWREICWAVPDKNHRTAIDNARELRMRIFLAQLGDDAHAQPSDSEGEEDQQQEISYA